MPTDFSTDFGQRAQQRLRDERIIWLTTVRKDGRPIPLPIWFVWDGDAEVFMYSQRSKAKLRNIAGQPPVSLNFDSDGTGGNIVQFDAEARIDNDAPPASAGPAFVEKYRDGLQSLGMTPEEFSSEYPVPIRVRLTNLRGH
jgi:PPOX class probable F420-dependent enzyme